MSIFLNFFDKYNILSSKVLPKSLSFLHEIWAIKAFSSNLGKVTRFLVHLETLVFLVNFVQIA